MHESDLMAYLTMMAVRLLEMRRVLKPTGSLYLHCDPTASHYLKILMDAIFGPKRFLSEIVWKRTGSHSGSKRWGPVHDIILFYRKSERYIWNKTYQAYDPFYVDEKYTREDEAGKFQDVSLTGPGVRHGMSGKAWRGFDPTAIGRHWAIPETSGRDMPDFEDLGLFEKLDRLDARGRIYWLKAQEEGGGFPRVKQRPSEGQLVQDCLIDIAALNSQARERLGYPTQKSLALLEPIVTASSKPGHVVLDPFCGCGTAIHAAQKLGRAWVGIDVTHIAISLIERRLTAFAGIRYTVHGVPQDLAGAAALADADKHQFQLWAISRIDGAQPFKGGKKGSDGGIDGFVYFKPDGKTTERAIVSVKGGGSVGVGMVKDVIATVDREKAKVGVFVTLAKPTKPLMTEAVAAGFCEPPYHAKVPKIQVLTVQELFAGKQPGLPMVDRSVFKRAAKEQGEQPKLI
jgi:DNA modification methylase